MNVVIILGGNTHSRCGARERAKTSGGFGVFRGPTHRAAQRAHEAMHDDGHVGVVVAWLGATPRLR